MSTDRSDNCTSEGVISLEDSDTAEGSSDISGSISLGSSESQYKKNKGKFSKGALVFC